jgi:sterol desaturase/sphingolipid hydroxylase (fatty acid hydroxylase superfamily)
MNLVHELLQQYLGACLPVVSDLAQYYGLGYAAVVVLGSAVWIVSQRKTQRFSLSALFGYLFPRALYRHPTMRVTYWNLFWRALAWGPLVALWVVSTPILTHALNNVLVSHFGPQGPMLHAVWLNVTVQTAALVLSSSLGFYTIHYASHKVPFLWSFHRAHHSTEALVPLSGSRAHPLDDGFTVVVTALFGGIGGGLVLFITGADKLLPAALAIQVSFLLWTTILDIFEHSHVPISFGWLNRIFYSPVMHQIHHSAELRHRDKNFGDFANLAIWDWMFGTLYIPHKHEQYRWGLNDAEYGLDNPHLDLKSFYLEPIHQAWRAIRGWISKQPA